MSRAEDNLGRMRFAYLRLSVMVSATVCANAASAETLSVGPNKPYAAPCAAIAAAKAGDTIEIDAAGTYVADVCYWATDNLTLRGVNGRPKMDAAGQASQGKAIWVIGGQNTLIENVELTGATVVDHNGAGIRQEGKNLTVRNAYFHHNEDGILAGDNPGSEILIEGCEFGFNGYSDGKSHNLYINHVAKLVFRANYSHDSLEGHLLKSRAAENYVLYNRLSQENGSGSYEINLPNGGKSFIIGNVIQQGPSSNNSNLVSYGEEGTNAANPSLELFVINNTFINDKGPGNFINVGGAVNVPVVIRNNIFAGSDAITSQSNAVLEANFSKKDGDPMFVNPGGFDYHLADASPCKDNGVDPAMGGGMPLTPTQQYVHPAMVEGRMSVGAIDRGAFELGGGTGGGGVGGSGTGGSGMGGGGQGAAGGGGHGAGGVGVGGDGNGGSQGGNNADGSGGGGSGAGESKDGGCGCEVAGASRGKSRAPLGAITMVVLGLASFVRRRR